MTTVLFLGAARFQCPPIEAAKRLGFHVLTADNRPRNPGHALADRSFDVSTADLPALLDLARRERIDGVVAFGSDVAAPAAARIAEQFGLPGNPPDAVETLVDKELFRRFQQRHLLKSPRSRAFTNPDEAAAFFQELRGGAAVKPADASGSRGVSLVREPGKLAEAFHAALAESRRGAVVVEEIVPRSGPQVCGDGFVVGGRLVSFVAGDGRFHDEPGFHAPFGETFPSAHRPEALERLETEIARHVELSGLRCGAVNVDAWLTPHGEPFVCEIGPRAGGNFIPTAISLLTGIDFPEAVVRAALEPNFRLPRARPDGARFVACHMLHSLRGGTLASIEIDPELWPHVVVEAPYLSPGDRVEPFRKGSAAVGALVLRFDGREEMDGVLARLDRTARVVLEG